MTIAAYSYPFVKQSFYDANGNPLSGGKLYTYAAGGTTPAVTYTTSATNVNNANPIILDSSGRCDVWLDSTISYKFELRDSLGNVIWTEDNVISGITTLSSSNTLAYNSISELRASNAPISPFNTVILNGYYTAGDGGNGIFYWDAASTATDNGGTIIQCNAATGRWMLEHEGIYNARQFGAKGDGTTDDYTSINKIITIINSTGGTLYLPKGNYRISTGLVILGNAITVKGDGVNNTILTGDLTVPVILTFGDIGTITAVINCKHLDMTVTRATGVITSNYVGVKWALFNYGYESGVLVDRNDINRFITGRSAGISIQWECYAPYSSNAQNCHYLLEHAAGIKFYGGEMGRNGVETFDSVSMVRITGTCNDVSFINTSFLPRGPSVSKPAVIFFSQYTNTTGVFHFESCNTENTSTLFTSDAGTPSVNEISINGGRFAPVTTEFNFNPATAITVFRAVNGVFSAPAILVNAKWSMINSCAFGDIFNIVGGTDAFMSMDSNVFIGTVTLSGAWDYLSFVGNTVQGTFTDTTTGKRTIANNSGVNPIGMSVMTVGASPYTYTAGSTSEEIYVTAGTVSQIAIGAAPIFSSTEKTFTLGPQQSATFTYTVLPDIRINKL